jgi:hypothetical protein
VQASGRSAAENERLQRLEKYKDLVAEINKRELNKVLSTAAKK